MKYLILLIVLLGCGREDQRKQKCTLYGEDCHNDSKAENSTKTVRGERGPAGKAGAEGPSGQDGVSGTNGDGCIISPAVNGALITCDSGSVLILNGLDGTDGSDAPPTPYSVTELIDPCGQQSSYDEVMLRLANGDLIVSFSENINGKNTRFVRLVPGTYQTTDGTGCIFTVAEDMSVTW